MLRTRLLALALSLLALLALPWGLGRLGRADAPAAPPVQAQGGPAPAANVTLTLHDNVIDWQTSPSTQVRAVVRANNQNKGTGQATSNATGFVRINVGGGGPGGGGPGGGGGGANIVPGDQILLIPAGGVTSTLTVPDFGVGVDAGADRVFGKAPAGSALQVVMGQGTAAVTRTVSAGGDGLFNLALAGSADLKPGDSGVTLLAAGGNTFRAAFAAINATASIGARSASGVTTPGEQVQVAIRGANGQGKGSRTTTVQGGPITWNVGQGGGGPGGGGPGGGNPFGPVTAGDTVTVTTQSSVAGAGRQLLGVVPDITITVDAATRQVKGTAAPGASVWVEALSPDGDDYAVPATADPSGGPGAWVAQLPAGADIGPGWRVSAVAEVVPGLAFRATDAIEQARVGVHSGQVNGVADPGLPITVTLLAAAGGQKAQVTTQANNNAQFNANFAGPNAADFEIGDVLEIEFVRGDPVSIEIPRLTARTDPAADTVSGEAPAESEIRVTQGGGQNARTASATADGAGRYSASFAGVRDIEPPMGGQLVARLSSGHELFTNWAAVRMTLEIGQNYLSGNGPNGRSVSASLVDKNITANVAAGEDDIGGGGGPGGGGPGGGGAGSGAWELEFVDTLGVEVPILTGDTVRATVGDDELELVVPPLSGVAFVADDLVNGKTVPNREVTMVVQRPLLQDSEEVTVSSDANGNFSHSFAGSFDLQFNDVVLFQIRDQGHDILSRILLPGLRVNLDELRVSGAWQPSTDIDLLLQRGAQTLVTSKGRTAADATFELVLESGGNRPLVNPGDRLVLRSTAAPADAITLVIPELTVAGDKDANTVAGRATPGGVLALQVQATFPRAGGGGPGGGGPGGGGQTRNVRPTINADGTWSTGFQPPYDVVPGTRMTALYREPSGHLVERIRHVPIANVQHGGGNVCGLALPRDAVEATQLAAGGATLASSRGTVGYDGGFEMTLEDANGDPTRTTGGQTVRAKLGAETVDVALPEITVAVTWGQAQIQGTGPANTPYFILRPARNCLDLEQRFTFGGQTGDDGSFSANAAFGVDPGDGFELAFYTAEGHRYYRHVFRALGQVYVSTEWVRGRTTPLGPVTVILSSAAGSERARATTTADSDGSFEARFLQGGNPVVIQPGDTVRLDASGETPDIAVEKLAFDWSRGDIVTLEGPPSRSVQMALGIEGRDPLIFNITTDAAGRWQFTAADVPPRAGWTLDDIVGVRAMIVTPNEHQIISEAGEAPEPPPDPEIPGRIYMPLTVKGTRLR